jgi:E3 ubiquitin-protein ligase HUWE1
LVISVPEILEFDSKRLLWKICIKKYLRKNVKDNGEFEIDLQVRRNQVFGDSFEQLKHIQLDSWKQKFTVEFHDEEGVDEGGLTKEWFELLSQGIFDPNYALFLQSEKGSTYYPNPSSVVHDKDEMIALFRFVGRFIGKAIIEGQLLDCYFVKAMYKMMLNHSLLLSDLEDYDA